MPERPATGHPGLRRARQDGCIRKGSAEVKHGDATVSLAFDACKRDDPEMCKPPAE
ncbi:MAG: hypothetical protein R3F61_30345 [Myxococcota bacterium]